MNTFIVNNLSSHASRILYATSGYRVVPIYFFKAFSEQPADLVEGLAGGVVEGAAELDDVGGDVPDAQQVGVPPGDDEPDEALGQGAVHQLVDRQVPDEWLTP